MHNTYSILTSASPEKVWQMWSDVKNWKNWDTALKDSSINGKFDKNAEGVLIPANGPRTSFTISSCKPNFTYTVNTRLPFATMYIRRLIGYNNNKTMITNEVWMEGPLSSFWWRMVGKKYQQLLPQVMERFRQIAER